MRTIGFRAAPKVVNYAIYSTRSKRMVSIDKIIIPIALEPPEALKFLRSHTLDILREYKVMKAGIRTVEPSAEKPSFYRIQMEGVIQEAFASSELKGFYIGQISSISARIGIDRKAFKPLIAGDRIFDLENWATLSPEAREATLCAIGAENA